MAPVKQKRGNFLIFIATRRLSPDVYGPSKAKAWKFIVTLFFFGFQFLLCSALHCMGMLLYLFCDGKTEDNLLGIFNLFDEDGNGTISIDELLNMMAFFIEIGQILTLLGRA